MTSPITTAPADTARAMHAAEMRGSDMQDAPAQHDQLATMISDLSHTGELSMLYRMAIADAITELRAECQRRIDAAVLAEREACAELCKWNAVGVEQGKGYVLSGWTIEMGGMHPGMAYAAAIRVRGQK